MEHIQISARIRREVQDTRLKYDTLGEEVVEKGEKLRSCYKCGDVVFEKSEEG